MANSYVYGVTDANQTKHIVAESSLLKATKTGHIASVKLHENRDNGTMLQLAAWASTDAMQVYTGKDCNDLNAPIYLVLQPALTYNNELKAMNEERYFYNASGDVVRAYELHRDDIFTISANGIDALSTAPVVGNYAYFDAADNKYTEFTPASGTELPAAAASDATYYGVCQIIEKVNYKNSVSYRLRFISVGGTVAHS